MPGGTENFKTYNMVELGMPKDPKLPENPTSKYDVGVDLKMDNMMPVDRDDLSDETKAQIDQKITEYESLLLSTFSKTRHGKIIQREKLPVVALIDEYEAEKSPADKPMEVVDEATLNSMIHAAIHHALINQSPVLVNTSRALII